MPRNDLIQVRRDTAANWTSVNPTLASGEIGLETDTGKLKVGTGSTAWASLLYVADASDITGTTLASNVVTSSLTTVGTLGSLNVTGNTVISGDVTVDTTTLKVDSTNNRVGVGTASPSASLDVVTSGSGNAVVITNSGTGNSLIVNDEGTDTSPFVIDASGNVGIGTSSPLFKADINGSARSSGYIEKWSTGGAATGAITLDAGTNFNYYYASNSSANWSLNVRWSSTVTLNTALATGDSIVVTFVSTQGASTFYNNSFLIDSSSQTVQWQGGTAPTAGNTNTFDVYVYTIIKLGTNSWRVFGSLTKFDP